MTTYISIYITAADTISRDLTVAEARALYNELRAIFEPPPPFIMPTPAPAPYMPVFPPPTWGGATGTGRHADGSIG